MVTTPPHMAGWGWAKAYLDNGSGLPGTPGLLQGKVRLLNPSAEPGAFAIRGFYEYLSPHHTTSRGSEGENVSFLASRNVQKAPTPLRNGFCFSITQPAKSGAFVTCNAQVLLQITNWRLSFKPYHHFPRAVWTKRKSLFETRQLRQLQLITVYLRLKDDACT